MNIAELATNVARDIGAVRQRSCKRADGVEYHFEQSELEQFANELITEYEKTVNSELYPRPDPRVAELEARLVSLKLEQTMRKHAESSNARLLIELSQIEAQNAALVKQLSTKRAYNGRAMSVQDHDDQVAALLVAIEAKDAALDSLVSWVDDWAETSDTDFPRLEAQVNAARAIHPTTELLEARDRKRDAKLLRAIANSGALSTDGVKYVFQQANSRADGSWNPELGD